MATITRDQQQDFDTIVQRCLAGGIDTQRLDNFLDYLFGLVSELGSLTCVLVGEKTLQVQARGTVLHEGDLPLAKAKLRMLCARLAVRGGEWANRNLSPYGDVIEVEVPVNKQFCRISFENTTISQRIEIEAISATA